MHGEGRSGEVGGSGGRSGLTKGARGERWSVFTTKRVDAGERLGARQGGRGLTHAGLAFHLQPLLLRLAHPASLLRMSEITFACHRSGMFSYFPKHAPSFHRHLARSAERALPSCFGGCLRGELGGEIRSRQGRCVVVRRGWGRKVVLRLRAGVGGRAQAEDLLGEAVGP